jgi:dihydroorotate dehydrogenase electron transfer subunit
MREGAVLLLDQQRFEGWATFTLGSAQLAMTKPGQFVALRCASEESYDPLLRQPLFVAATDQRDRTAMILLPDTHPAYLFLNSQPRGVTLDVLGPLGEGWKIDDSVRTVALLGTAIQAPALFALAQLAVARRLAVSVSIGVTSDEATQPANAAQMSAPPAFLLPAAAEYHVAHGSDPAEAALALLDEQLLRWADLLAIALPARLLPHVAHRVRTTRLQWSRGFAQAALFEPADTRLACCVGMCGACMIETRRERRLACSSGPIFDLRDLVG